MADIDLSAIFNEVNTIASLAQTKVSGDLSTHANAIPKGTTTTDLVWPGKNHQVGKKFGPYTSYATDWGWANPTYLTLSCSWDYGGTYDGLGLYIANVHLYLGIQDLGISEAVDVTGTFDDPTPIGDKGSPIAQLSATLQMKYSQFLGANAIDFKTVKFAVRGNGDADPPVVVA